MCPNHISWFDPLQSAHFLFDNGRPPRYLGKESVFRIPVAGRIIRGAGQIPVYRETANAADSVRDAIAAVAPGRVRRGLPRGHDHARSRPVAHDRAHGCRAHRARDRCPRAARWPSGARRRSSGRTPASSGSCRARPCACGSGPPVDLDDLRGRPIDAAVLHEATERIIAAITAQLEAHPGGDCSCRSGSTCGRTARRRPMRRADGARRTTTQGRPDDAHRRDGQRIVGHRVRAGARRRGQRRRAVGPGRHARGRHQPATRTRATTRASRCPTALRGTTDAADGARAAPRSWSSPCPRSRCATTSPRGATTVPAGCGARLAHEGHRAGHDPAHERGRRRGRRASTPARVAVVSGSEPGARDRRAAAGRDHRRVLRRRGRAAGRRRVHHGVLPSLLEHRRRRHRDRRLGQERHRARQRHGRRDGLRRERAVRADHARARRDDAARASRSAPRR